MTSSSGAEGGPADLQPVTAHAVSEERKLARALGSTDWHLRDAGVKQVLAQLARQSSLPDPVARQLWKGLFYAFWHSDKAQVQVRLTCRVGSVNTQHLKPSRHCRKS